MYKSLGIVLPTIGREDFLDKSISSLLNQSEAADEFLVFDNSVSQDLQKKSKFGDHKEIKWILSGKQLNPIESWNTAILSSSCEYVTIAGDDDIFLQNYIKEVKEILQIADMGFLKPMIIDEHDNEIKLAPFPIENVLPSNQFRHYRFNSKISLYTPGSTFKKDFFEKVGGYQNSNLPGVTASDEWLYFKMSCLSEKVALSKEVCWKYRIHSGQIINADSYMNYVNKADQYIDSMEKSLINLGINKADIYPLNYNKRDYLGRLCKFGAEKYIRASFSKKTSKSISLSKSFIIEFITNSKLSTKDRFSILVNAVLIFLKLK